MKKSLVILLVGCTFAMGVIVGDRSWERLRIFAPVVIVSQVPSEVHHFRLAAVPPFSSDHYYFRDGFADVDEYWSFRLPPEQAESFLASYVQQNHLSRLEETKELPMWILGASKSEWTRATGSETSRNSTKCTTRSFSFVGTPQSEVAFI